MKLNPTSETSTTRERILGTAFREFYQHGFQGGSINRIVTDAGITKGALFHHFTGKVELGYHVVDEVIRPYMEEKWIKPLREADDPIRTLRQILYRAAETMKDSVCQGCPLNNLALEMSPLDEGFRTRINLIYDAQRTAVREAFERGIAAGHVGKSVNPARAAAFIVAALTGMVGTAKNAQCMDLMRQAGEGLIDYLDSLKP